MNECCSDGFVLSHSGCIVFRQLSSYTLTPVKPFSAVCSLKRRCAKPYKRLGLGENRQAGLCPSIWRVYAINAIESAEEWPYLRPLLLTFFASQRRSVLAATSLVQTAIELYQEGTAWADIQLELKLAGIREGQHINQLDEAQRKKARLMVDLEKDVLLQWIGLIFMTLEELHVDKAAGAGTAVDESSRMVKGMRGFVQHTLSLKFDSQRLQLQQQMAFDERGEALPSIKLMQENVRLIVLTTEAVDRLQQPQASSGPQSKDPDSQSSEAQPVDAERIESPQARVRGQSQLVGTGLRQRAARILLGFLGAVQGSRYSVTAFLEEVFSCYLAGWAAHEVYSSLQPEDFVCGKAMFPIAAAEGSSKINADVFGHWISAVYMTLAQVGVPHKRAKESFGWAWASPLHEYDAVSANRLSNLVSTTLTNEAEEAGLPPAADSEASAAVKASPRASQSPKSGHDFAVLEDPHLSESSSAVGLMSQLLNLVTLTRRLAASTQRQDAS